MVFRIPLPRTLPTLALALWPVAAAVPALAQQPAPSKPPARVRVERSDQLPRHVYPVSTTAMALLQDDQQFVALTSRLEADLRGQMRYAWAK